MRSVVPPGFLRDSVVKSVLAQSSRHTRTCHTLSLLAGCCRYQSTWCLWCNPGALVIGSASWLNPLFFSWFCFACPASCSLSPTWSSACLWKDMTCKVICFLHVTWCVCVFCFGLIHCAFITYYIHYSTSTVSLGCISSAFLCLTKLGAFLLLLLLLMNSFYFYWQTGRRLTRQRENETSLS